MDTFFEHDRGDRYVAGPMTGGPWDPRMQHGGPVSALLARIVDDIEQIPGQRLARVSFELLRPVPIGPMRITGTVVRSGKKVSLVDAILTDDEGGELMRARAWRLQPSPIELEETPAPGTMPPPDGLVPIDHAFGGTVPGFMHGVEVRFTQSSFTELGPGAAWFRLRKPLVAGTAARATDVVFVAADCGNGISGILDFRRYVFVNPDLTVHLSRLPDGEWVGLDAETTIVPNGISIAAGILQDARGRLGRTAQSLFVEGRGA